jgi:hypothetical protein
VLFTFGTSTFAQDFEEEKEDAANANAQVAFELNENNFDAWVFGNVTPGNTYRTQLNSSLMTSLGEIDRACKLTESQKKKLLLAGKGDIKRFQDKLGEARKVFNKLRHDQNNIQAIFQETQPLATMLRSGLFGADSLFSKAISSTLEPEQAALYRKVLQEKYAFRQRANVQLAVVKLDQTIGLTAEQRRKLIDLLLVEMKPSSRSSGEYESPLMILKMGKIPEAKLKTVLDETRYKALKAQIQQYQAWEQFFRNNGLLDDDGTDEPKVEAIGNEGGFQ